jgi:hypothetical protein
MIDTRAIEKLWDSLPDVPNPDEWLEKHADIVNAAFEGVMEMTPTILDVVEPDDQQAVFYAALCAASNTPQAPLVAARFAAALEVYKVAIRNDWISELVQAHRDLDES